MLYSRNNLDAIEQSWNGNRAHGSQVYTGILLMSRDILFSCRIYDEIYAHLYFIPRCILFTPAQNR